MAKLNATQRNYILGEAFASLLKKLNEQVNLNAVAIKARQDFIKDKDAVLEAIKEGKIKLRAKPKAKGEYSAVGTYYATDAYNKQRAALANKAGLTAIAVDKRPILYNPVHTGDGKYFYSTITEEFVTKVEKANEMLKNLKEELIIGSSEEARKLLDNIKAVEL